MKTFLLIFLAIIGIGKLHAQQSWKSALDDDGIKVFVGEVSNSDYYAFKAIMSVKTTEAEVLKNLKDVNKYPEWFAFTASARLMSKSDTEQSFFMETDYPWPFSNECMNYQMNFEKLQGTSIKVSITGTPNNVQCPLTLKKASGYILLEPEQGSTRITYYFHSEPSQNIPPWLINPRIHEMPYQTFKALRKRLHT